MPENFRKLSVDISISVLRIHQSSANKYTKTEMETDGAEKPIQ